MHETSTPTHTHGAAVGSAILADMRRENTAGLLQTCKPSAEHESPPIDATLKASAVLTRASGDPRFHSGAAAMADPTSGAVGAIFLKFLPAGIGAALMVAVDPPKDRRELFARAFVAFACSYLFGDTLFDFLDSTNWFAFLDAAKRHHHVAVDGFVGAVGWAAAGGMSMWLKRFRTDPVAAVKELKP
jgi:hypothetical protein